VGVVFGLTSFPVAMGSVPKHSRVTDDTAIYQRLSEIRVPKQGALSFDNDIARLMAMESRYKENLPTLREKQLEKEKRERKKLHASVQRPLQRIEARKYRFSGTAQVAQK